MKNNEIDVIYFDGLSNYYWQCNQIIIIMSFEWGFYYIFDLHFISLKQNKMKTEEKLVFCLHKAKQLTTYIQVNFRWWHVPMTRENLNSSSTLLHCSTVFKIFIPYMRISAYLVASCCARDRLICRLTIEQLSLFSSLIGFNGENDFLPIFSHE